MNRHPAQEEADGVRATYKEKTCSYGDDCQTEGCLYWHPWEETEHTAYSEDICLAVGGINLEDSAAADTAVPTYEQWLALNCPSPPTMDENYVYNIWHYPGSGMQRDPWEVYCLMYPQQFNGSTSLNTSAQTWEPSANNNNGVMNAAAPQSWDPAHNNIQQQEEDPKSFQEWKKKGQPYPSWFCSDVDPWYDDEGMRRGLEEVYEVLYGENAEENFALNQQAHQVVAADPTPAELATMISINDPQALGASPSSQQTSAKGGWASIAAKRPVPVQKPTAATGNNDFNSNTGNQSAAVGESSANNHPKSKMVVIPKEVWLPSTANSDCFHLFPNPIERFNAVNQHHKSYLSSVMIPLCFEKSGSNQSHNEGSKNKVTLLDVHFQSAKTITPVLNRFLSSALKKNDEVWIVTGSGNHVGVGHQRREGGGVLFNAVKRYLEDHEEDLPLEFRMGKDTSGGKNKSSGGAFLVRRRAS